MYQLLCRWGVPVSEKKVENPWSSSALLRSSVRYPSGYILSVLAIVSMLIVDIPGYRARDSRAERKMLARAPESRSTVGSGIGMAPCDGFTNLPAGVGNLATSLAD